MERQSELGIRDIEPARSELKHMKISRCWVYLFLLPVFG